MFKKDDYIVTLDCDYFITKCAKKNYCFKQREDSIYIKPVKDLFNDKTNGNNSLTFDKKERLKNWRYANENEIKEYSIESDFAQFTCTCPFAKNSHRKRIRKEIESLTQSKSSLKQNIFESMKNIKMDYLL